MVVLLLLVLLLLGTVSAAPVLSFQKGHVAGAELPAGVNLDRASTACNRQKEVKVRSTSGNASAEQVVDGWTCITRQECDPVFQFTSVNTEFQHVCEDYPRTDYILQFDSDISTLDTADWQLYFAFQSDASAFDDEARFQEASAVHVHGCQNERLADTTWAAHCSIHFEPKDGERRADAGRAVALTERARTQTQRQRRGFGGKLEGKGSFIKLDPGVKTCSFDLTKRCCKRGWGVEGGACVECNAKAAKPEFSNTDLFRLDSTDAAAKCQEHPTCIDDEGVRWGFYDTDGTMTGTVLGLGDVVDRFGDDHYFLTKMSPAVCRAQTGCKAAGKLLQTASSEYFDAVCGDSIVYCTLEQYWTNAGATTFQEPEWASNPTCDTLITCTHKEQWTNSVAMNSALQTGIQYTVDRECSTRAECAATEFLNNFDDVVAAKDTTGSWKPNNVLANNCLPLATCTTNTEYEIAPPQVSKLGWGETECKDTCGTITNTSKCGLKECYGCEKCYGEDIATSQRYCAAATLPCATNEFEQVLLTPTSNRICTPWEICEFVGNYEYESTAPTSTTDRVCTLTTQCNLATEFMTLESTEFADRECATATPDTTAEPYYFEEDECSSGHDSRAGATSEAQCLALQDCTYNAHCDHCYNSGRVFYMGCEEEQEDNGYAFKCGGCNQAICVKLCDEQPDDCGGDEYFEACKRYNDECTPLVGEFDSYCGHLDSNPNTD